ncbi:MAG: LLM class flavin-dependent oxidoreductase [Chloroflexi bacterium]|nr:LLM class flavin-dependent oxidoreductase [Chloroflexota bacterium]
MEIGVGLDRMLPFSVDEFRELARAAASLGYTSVWTNSMAGRDATQMCTQFWDASRGAVEGGLQTGVSVVPAPFWTVPSLASAAATTADVTGGRFTLGVGSGDIHSLTQRRLLGLQDISPLKLARDYLVTLRAILAGQEVTYEGPTVQLQGFKLEFPFPKTPVILGALGPQMLRLAGEAADGVGLNWCAAEQIAWSRERLAEGAARAGRDPREVKVIEYIRVSVDDDADACRRAYMKALFRYAIARPGVPKHLGYRGHFARMGFDEALTELEERRDRGATLEELYDAMPVDLAQHVGYFGPAAGAAAAFRRLCEGLDVALVRVVPARPTLDSAIAVMEACRPALVHGAA